MSIPVWETLATHLAMHWLLTGVKLLNVKTQVRFPSASGGTQFTLVHWLVPGVNGPVSFQTVALCLSLIHI